MLDRNKEWSKGKTNPQSKPANNDDFKIKGQTNWIQM